MTAGQGVAAGWQAAILDFWFGLEPARHWRRDPVLDQAIIERFGDLWEAQRHAAAASFLLSADAALAAILLFDQFPRNMFRDDRRAFATDALARSIAGAALARGFDVLVSPDRRLFFYMPLQHSEDPADQAACLRLVQALGDDRLVGYARKHRDVIARFGRFPHRNGPLGRESTADEAAFALEPAW